MFLECGFLCFDPSMCVGSSEYFAREVAGNEKVWGLPGPKMMTVFVKLLQLYNSVMHFYLSTLN